MDIFETIIMAIGLPIQPARDCRMRSGNECTMKPSLDDYGNVEGYGFAEKIADCARILVYVIAALAVLVSAAVLCENQASGAQEMQASPARTDGPIYDLPEGIGQEIVCDERNREYLLLTTEQGGVLLMPYLDEDGEQEIMPQA